MGDERVRLRQVLAVVAGPKIDNITTSLQTLVSERSDPTALRTSPFCTGSEPQRPAPRASLT